MISTAAAAKGSLFWDDGTELNLEHYFTATYDATPASFKAAVTDHGYTGTAPAIGAVKIYGMPAVCSLMNLSRDFAL